MTRLHSRICISRWPKKSFDLALRTKKCISPWQLFFAKFEMELFWVYSDLDPKSRGGEERLENARNPRGTKDGCGKRGALEFLSTLQCEQVGMWGRSTVDLPHSLNPPAGVAGKYVLGFHQKCNLKMYKCIRDHRLVFGPPPTSSALRYVEAIGVCVFYLIFPSSSVPT